MRRGQCSGPRAAVNTLQHRAVSQQQQQRCEVGSKAATVISVVAVEKGDGKKCPVSAAR
jgi:hypothetical protein